MIPDLTDQLRSHNSDALRAISPDESALCDLPAAHTLSGHPGAERQDQSLQFLLASIQDLNVRGQLEQILRDKDSQLAGAAEAQDRLVSRLSHDMRNPLNSIIG